MLGFILYISYINVYEQIMNDTLKWGCGRKVK